MGPKNAKTNNRPNLIDSAKFLQLLNDEFPEVPATVDKSAKGLLHCEMGAFAGLTEEAMDAGRFWQTEIYFRFIEKVRKKATSGVRNAIDVSYLEYLAFSEKIENRYQGMKRIPESLRRILLEIDGRGRWA